MLEKFVLELRGSFRKKALRMHAWYRVWFRPESPGDIAEQREGEHLVKTFK
jgi:predicted metal-dependent hydrolase